MWPLSSSVRHRRAAVAIIRKIKAWYQGRYVPPPPSDPNSELVFVTLGHYERPLVARILSSIGRFWLAHWQWIIGTALAIIGIIVAL